MNILEKELEDIIYESWLEDGGRTLASRGFIGQNSKLIGGRIYRQVRLPGCGVLDLLIVNSRLVDGKEHTYILVVELKRGALDIFAHQQICRYLATIGCALHTSDKMGKYTYAGVLVGRSVEESEWMHQANQSISGIGILTYSLDLEGGLRFKNDNMLYYPTQADLSGIADTICEMASSDREISGGGNISELVEARGI